MGCSQEAPAGPETPPVVNPGGDGNGNGGNGSGNGGDGGQDEPTNPDPELPDVPM